MKAPRHLIAAAAIGALAIAGCGDDGDAGARPPAKPQAAKTVDPTDPTAIPTTDPEGPYVGSWYARLTRKQALDAGDERMAGTFRLELGRDGRYTTDQGLDGQSSGRYRAASDNRLVFGRDVGCKMGGVSGTGVYGWSMNGGRLHLKPLLPETGGCTGRTQSLTYPAEWRRR